MPSQNWWYQDLQPPSQYTQDIGDNSLVSEILHFVPRSHTLGAIFLLE